MEEMKKKVDKLKESLRKVLVKKMDEDMEKVERGLLLEIYVKCKELQRKIKEIKGKCDKRK